MNRRQFLKNSSLALSGFALSPHVHANKPKGKTLILIELKGGNDGLNTLIPFNDLAYYNLRPNIGIKRNNVIQLTEQLGLHPALKPLIKTWKNNDCAIIKGVGYPQQNRSHFRSIEIWDSASDSQEVLQNGWLNNVVSKLPESSKRVIDGVVFGSEAGALLGDDLRVIHMKQKLGKFSSQNKQHNTLSPALKHVLKVEALLDQANSHFKSALKPLKTKHYFPKHSFANDLKLAAQIIASDADVPVIKISLGSFDTHGSQLNTHQVLLKKFADGVSAFEKTMQQLGLWDQVLLMTYSEFGRRAGENGSRGTDHGTAAPHFVIGGKVNGGFYGKQPSLTDLENKDLKHHVDFRQLYSRLETHWFGVESDIAKEFKGISFI